MPDLAAPSLHVFLPAAPSPARTPTEFSAALPLPSGGTPFEEVAGAGSSQAARKAALTCPAPGTSGAGTGNGAKVWEDGGKSG